MPERGHQYTSAVSGLPERGADLDWKLRGRQINSATAWFCRLDWQLSIPAKIETANQDLHIDSVDPLTILSAPSVQKRLRLFPKFGSMPGGKKRRSMAAVHERESCFYCGSDSAAIDRLSIFSQNRLSSTSGPTLLDRSAKRRGRTAICRSECVVEPPHAAKPCGEGYVGQAHRGLIYQPFRSLHTSRRGDFARRRTRMTEKQP